MAEGKDKEKKGKHVGRETHELKRAGYDTEGIRVIRSADGISIERPVYAGENTAMVPRERTLGEQRADSEAPKEPPAKAEECKPKDYCRVDCRGKGSFDGSCGSWPSGDYTFSCRGKRDGHGHTACNYKA